MSLRGLVMGAAMLSLVGCVPYWTAKYYEPSAPGGSLHKIERCPGPRDELEFALGDVVIHVGAHHRGGRLSAFMAFAVPQGHVVQLLANQVRMRLNDGMPRAGEIDN